MNSTEKTKQTNATSNSQHSELRSTVNAMLKGDFRNWVKFESVIRAATRYHKNYGLIVCVANNSCETVKDAIDDIVSDIKINLFKNSCQFLRTLAGYDDNRIRQYMAKSVYNCCVSKIRTISKDIISYYPVYEERAPFDCAEDKGFDAEDKALLYRLIESLPFRQRNAVKVWLRHEDDGLDYREMAALAGVSKTAFGKSLHMAKDSLAATLRQSATPAF